MKVVFAIVACLVLGTLAKDHSMVSKDAPAMEVKEPTDLISKVETIPTTPTCSLRPTAVNEIAKLRLKHTDLKSHVAHEQSHAYARKQYITRMTGYLNTKIEELNKVKEELAQGEKWLKVSDQRLKSYTEKEKLIKLEDVLTCLTKTKESSEKNKASHEVAIKDLEKQKKEVSDALDKIKEDLKKVAGSSDSKPSAYL